VIRRKKKKINNKWCLQRRCCGEGMLYCRHGSSETVLGDYYYYNNNEDSTTPYGEVIAFFSIQRLDENNDSASEGATFLLLAEHVARVLPFVKILKSSLQKQERSLSPILEQPTTCLLIALFSVSFLGLPVHLLKSTQPCNRSTRNWIIRH
jgi:hypothetical protein